MKGLRDFARLDEGDLKGADLNDGIRLTADIIRPQAKKQGVELQLELNALPQVMCYPAKVNQVVMNRYPRSVRPESVTPTEGVAGGAEGSGLFGGLLPSGMPPGMMPPGLGGPGRRFGGGWSSSSSSARSRCSAPSGARSAPSAWRSPRSARPARSERRS